MGQREDFSRTISYGEAAVGQLKRHEIPAYPRNYELWYTYSAGFNHALNKAVNEILRKEGDITIDDVNVIYNRYLSPLRLSDRIDDVGTKMSGEIDAIVDLIEKSIANAGDFRQSLQGASDELQATNDQNCIKSIVERLIQVTDGVSKTNRVLEDQLSESHKQIAELQESLEAIRFESLTDELTTLSNRKHFDQSIERAIAECRESGNTFALLMTDIDHFKKFNDTYGHQTGDQVLRLVGLSVKQNVKGQDIACRYGGEEFAIILPRTDRSQAVILAEHIRKAVMSKELVKRSTGENLGRITISIGVAQYAEGDSSQSVIERADACMYAAKRAGRNQVKSEDDLKDMPAGQVA